MALIEILAPQVQFQILLALLTDIFKSFSFSIFCSLFKNSFGLVLSSPLNWELSACDPLGRAVVFGR